MGTTFLKIARNNKQFKAKVGTMMNLEKIRKNPEVHMENSTIFSAA
jgi:hypothetical protein